MTTAADGSNLGGSQQSYQQNLPQSSNLGAAPGYPDFENLVTQIRNNDTRLMDRVLEPDGYFQTRRTTLSEITRAITELNKKGFRGRSAEDSPTIIVGWGKCRVGSTALTNLFGIAGILAYYNPIKTAVRHFVLNSPAEAWHVPSRAEHNFVFAKEMSGPYFLADCTVNPLQILVEAGYPASRIELLVLDRDPYRSLAGWLNIWGHLLSQERLVQHYVLSALNAIRIKEFAIKVGIRTSHYVYEASRIPDMAISKMFRRFGVQQLYRGEVVDGWNERGALASEHSKIIFPVLPQPIKTIPGMHASEPRYLYKERSADRISSEHKALIERTGVIECYRETALCCANELGIGIDDRRKLFEHTPLDTTSPLSPTGTEAYRVASVRVAPAEKGPEHRSDFKRT